MAQLSDFFRRRHFQLCSVLLHQQIRFLLLVVKDLGSVGVHYQITEANHGDMMSTMAMTMMTAMVMALMMTTPPAPPAVERIAEVALELDGGEE